MNLFDLYLQIGQSRQADSLQAKLFPGRENDYIARGSKGEPTVLIANNGGRTHVAPIALRNIFVEYAAEMEICVESQVTQGSFIVLSASESRPDLYGAFCAMVDAVVSGLPLNPTVFEIEQTIQSLIELFRAANTPPKKTVVGLWGELLIIDASPDPEAMLRAWHVTPFDKHDFVFDTSVIEIKSTERSERIHEFSHDQLIPIADKDIFIVSVLLRRTSTGCSCQDIADSILLKLSEQKSRLKFLHVVYESLGDEVYMSNDLCFDRKEALNLLRRVRAGMLPRVEVPLNSGISNVKYSINLEAGLSPIFLEEVSWEQLFSLK